MIILGLTGSMAMGKSTIGAMMTVLGIPVLESDYAVHRLLELNSPARPALATAFPHYEFSQIYDRKSKAIKRKELGALVFSNEEHRQTLEQIIHPFVQEKQNEFIRAETLKRRGMVCLDIPLLFETGAQARVDYTIVASAPLHTQRQRAFSRPHMNEEKFHTILKRQMPDAEKCVRADYVVKTGLGRAHSMKALKLIILHIREKEGLNPDMNNDACIREKNNAL